MSDTEAGDVVEHVAPTPFQPTLERIERAIMAAGLTIFARIDHAAGAREMGLLMRPATVLIYGHPKGGTPAMQAVPRVALDLPLRVLVREREDGAAVIAFHPVGPMLRRAGVAEEVAARLEPAQRLLVTALAQGAAGG
jgi:uncharacterized protein (DUF302 family)